MLIDVIFHFHSAFTCKCQLNHSFSVWLVVAIMYTGVVLLFLKMRARGRLEEVSFNTWTECLIGCLFSLDVNRYMKKNGDECISFAHGFIFPLAASLEDISGTYTMKLVEQHPLKTMKRHRDKCDTWRGVSATRPWNSYLSMETLTIFQSTLYRSEMKMERSAGTPRRKTKRRHVLFA